MYNLTDIKCAKITLSLAGQLDRFSNPMVGQDAIDWANDVLSFFAKIYNYARKCVGHWTCRLKLAYNWMKSGFKDETEDEIRYSIQFGTLAKRFKGIFVYKTQIVIPDNFYHSQGKNDFTNYKLPE